MRISEALALNDEHVDVATGVITIRNSKFNKSRQLPIHPTTGEALAAYVVARTNVHCVPGEQTGFFVSDTGRRIAYGQCRTTFADCAAHAGVTARSPRCRPRLHDLRHTFAVNTLIGWYSNGIDVNVSLPCLSTYLGHVDPSSTYWYLTGSPELAAVIAGRLDNIDSDVNP